MCSCPRPRMQQSTASLAPVSSPSGLVLLYATLCSTGHARRSGRSTIPGHVRGVPGAWALMGILGPAAATSQLGQELHAAHHSLISLLKLSSSVVSSLVVFYCARGCRKTRRATTGPGHQGPHKAVPAGLAPLLLLLRLSRLSRRNAVARPPYSIAHFLCDQNLRAEC